MDLERNCRCTAVFDLPCPEMCRFEGVRRRVDSSLMAGNEEDGETSAVLAEIANRSRGFVVGLVADFIKRVFIFQFFGIGFVPMVERGHGQVHDCSTECHFGFVAVAIDAVLNILPVCWGNKGFEAP